MSSGIIALQGGEDVNPRLFTRLFTRKPKAVGMGSPTTVLGRVKSIARANISELLEEADEPEKMANGLITRYEAALDEARTAVQQAITSLRATQGKQAEDEEQIPVWRDEAEMAAARARSLQSKDADGSAEAEELALRALKEERRLTIRVDNRRASIEDQEEILDPSEGAQPYRLRQQCDQIPGLRGCDGDRPRISHQRIQIQVPQLLRRQASDSSSKPGAIGGPWPRRAEWEASS